MCELLAMNSTSWTPLERWPPVLFMAGGGLLFGHASVVADREFTPLVAPPDVFAPAGHLLALVGLVGLGRAALGTPRKLKRLALGVSALVAGGWGIITTAVVANLLVGLPPGLEQLLGAAAGVTLVSTILPYLLLGGTILRTETVSRRIGHLVLGPAVLLIMLFSTAALGGVSALGGLLVALGLSLSTIAIGTALRVSAGPEGGVVTAEPVTGG